MLVKVNKNGSTIGKDETDIVKETLKVNAVLGDQLLLTFQ